MKGRSPWSPTASFPRFGTPIREGWKTQTIRAAGKRRHARPGELIQLYCGLRTPACRKIVPDVRCTDVMAVEITFARFPDDSPVIKRIHTDGVPCATPTPSPCETASPTPNDMAAFWRPITPGALAAGFKGVLIEWRMPRVAQALEVAA